MEFFNKLSKKASETYKYTTEKTSKLAKEAKLKMKMNENKSDIDDLYREIGKKVYEKHVREENINIKEELEEECTKIDVLSAEVEATLKECLKLKDRKQCQNCYTEIEKDAQYCPNCGAKQDNNDEENSKKPEKSDNSDDVTGNETSENMTNDRVNSEDTIDSEDIKNMNNIEVEIIPEESIEEEATEEKVEEDKKEED